MTSPTDAPLYAFRTNLVVTASAGTGKTFRLVTLYALLALGLSSKGQRGDDEAAPPVPPSRIAATTFSRAAAAEIRERVEAVLASVAAADDDPATAPYRAILRARAAETGSPEITSRATRELAERALGELARALIDTLHGLSGRIVRAFALELGSSPGFTILEEEAARGSTDAVIEEALSDALERSERAAIDLLDAGGGLVMTRKRVADLLDRADEEGVSVADLAVADHARHAREKMSQLAEIAARLLAAGAPAFAEPAEMTARAARAFLEGGIAEEDLARALEPLFGKRSPPRPGPAEEAFFAFRETVRGDTNADRARRLAAFAAASGGLAARARGMADLIAEMGRRRASARRRAGVLGFGDLLRTARDALRDRPEIAAAARAMFDVVLVDEFQDTSRTQRDIVYLLRERGERAAERARGALPGALDLEPSGLLVVGDRKQSIYGFRGADVTVFTRVCAELAGARAAEALHLGSDFGVPEQPNAALVSLAENRRSHPAILRFVNRFAEEDFAASSAYPFDLTYAASEHLRAADDAGPPDARAADPAPRVVIVDDRAEPIPDAPPLVRGASAPMREALIAAALVDRAVREAPFGPLAFGDFAILARRRATLPLLEFALARFDIPYAVAGRGLFETREVHDVSAMLRLLLDPGDRLALATVLRGPWAALTDTSLALLSRAGAGLAPPAEWFRAEGGGLADRLPEDERERLAHFYARFVSCRRLGLGVGPADAIRYAVEELDFDRVGAALPRAAQRLGNVERLIGLASQRGGSLPAFVRWLEQQIADQGDESEAVTSFEPGESVTLMTIHASKGLEFRAVVVVDLGAGVRAAPLSLALAPGGPAEPARFVARHVRAGGGTLFTPEGLEHSREATARDAAERRRLTYVAMTRARERLFLLTPPLPTPPTSAATTLRRLLPELATSPQVAVEAATPYLLRTPPAATSTAPLVAPSAPARPAAASGPLSLSTTPLGTFEQCPRRYRLIHEMGVDPDGLVRPGTRAARGPDLDDRRELGTAAHRVLERWPLSAWGTPTDAAAIAAALAVEAPRAPRAALSEVADNVARFLAGPYAARMQRDADRVYREEPFVLVLPSGAGSLSLRGTIDLLATFRDGSAEVIDYKSAWRPDRMDHELQLGVYALAARKRYGASSVRAGIVPLGSGHGAVELTPFDDAALAALESRLARLHVAFLAARAADDFAGVPIERCEALGCGFLLACHGAGPR